MTLIKTNTRNPIRGVIVPKASQKEDCYAVISKLDFADLGRGAGTLHTVGAVRLDMQGLTTAGDVNLQVQIGGGTVAAALISKSLQETTGPANQKGVANGAISILNQSMDTGMIWTLTGELP